MARTLTEPSNCPFCNEAGYLELTEQATRRLIMHPCPHQAEQVGAIEERLGASRA